MQSNLFLKDLFPVWGGELKRKQTRPSGRETGASRVSTMRSYDDAVAFLGRWGLFQQVVFFMLCVTILPNGFGGFMLVLLTDVPDHSCRVPDGNLTEAWRGSVIPVQVVNGKEELSKCTRYKLDVVRNLSSHELVPGVDVDLSGLELESCVDGWNYSKDVYESTIVTEFDLVCGEQWKQPFTTMVFFTGVLTGCFFSGQLSDRFGRKPILFATIAMQTLFTFMEIFSPSWIVFVILLFINGLGQMSNFVSALVLGSETLTGNVRIIYASMGTNMAFAAGYMILPLIAYFLRDWKSLLLALSVPCLAYIPFWWLIPESPRWLLSQGRVEEAEAILRNAAKWNKVQAPEVIFEDYLTIKTEKQDKRNESFFVLLRHSNIRNTTLILCLLWFTTSVGYYSLSFNTAQLHANPYLSCFISAVVEIPAYISSWLVLQYLPRRVSAISCLVFGAVPLFILLPVPEDLPNLILALEMLSKFFLTCGFSLMFAYASELFPTVIRNTATGTCNTCARIGCCVTPFLLTLSNHYKYLPYIILGILNILSAIATLFLPDTFKKPLPETIEEMQMQRDRISCPCITRTNTSSSKDDQPTHQWKKVAMADSP
ncbi:solute carrier family 22 member 4-like [Salarias fasciatus]|uniref:Solute carrier family 22 member 4-like n=1 Tax=Salarias fasciatus TaxID=181472 RepID=A0A672I6U6_SALFA|nr:solute carrier family 22 member 4-like [Salarias fasciatus]